MIDESVLNKLSQLARIHIEHKDVQSRLSDLQSILKCVSVLEGVHIPADFVSVTPVMNHVRADEVIEASVETVAHIVDAFPANQLGQLVVPEVLKKN